VLLPSQTSSERFKISGGGDGDGMVVITRKVRKKDLMGTAEIENIVCSV
jgi:hypothetical protein